MSGMVNWSLDLKQKSIRKLNFEFSYLKLTLERILTLAVLFLIISKEFLMNSRQNVHVGTMLDIQVLCNSQFSTSNGATGMWHLHRSVITSGILVKNIIYSLSFVVHSLKPNTMLHSILQHLHFKTLHNLLLLKGINEQRIRTAKSWCIWCC